MARPLHLRIDVAGDDEDPERVDDATRRLREELLELDVDAVDRPSGEIPEGARAAEAIALGSLLVTLGPHALAAVSSTVQGWMARGGQRSVTLELDGDRIELSGATAEDQRQLVQAFVARHAGG